MVTLNDYNTSSGDETSGFLGGQATGQAELLKAIQAGSITGRDTTGLALTQEPLKVESLEKTLKNLETRAKDIKLINALPKITAYNTVEEFVQLVSYGQQVGGFYNEGELSDVQDSVYTRQAQYVKYLQITGEVTLQAQMVKSYVEAMGQEVKNKMMWISRLADKTLSNGDSNVIPQQFDGIFKQHASVGSGNFLYPTFDAYYNSGTVVDLRGRSLKQGDVEDGSVKVDAQFGNVDMLFAPTTVISALSKDYYQTQRILQNGRGFDGMIGSTPKAISTTLGDVELMSDKFIAQGAPKTTATIADSTKAPQAPATVVGAVVADTLAQFTTPEQGTVYYAVAAVNRFGESVLVGYATALTIATGHSIALTVTPGTGSIAPDGYVVYRSLITASGSITGVPLYPVFKVSATELANGYNGGAAGVIWDRGYFMPNTEQAFILEASDEVLSIKQLAPLSKLDLATISMSRRFIIFQFLCLSLAAPKKVVRYINCSKTYTNP